jgi:hypothetical protein
MSCTVSLKPSGERSSSKTISPTRNIGFGNLPALIVSSPGRMLKVLPGVTVRKAQSRFTCLRVKLPSSVSFVEIGSFGSPLAIRIVADTSSL